MPLLKPVQKFNKICTVYIVYSTFICFIVFEYVSVLPPSVMVFCSEHQLMRRKKYLVVLQRMSHYYNDVSATCPTCYRVFNSSNNKRANQNSMEQHQQVRIFFVERFRLKDLEIMEFRCTGPRSTLAPFAECRNSAAKKIDWLSHKEKLTKTATRSQANAVQHVEAGACPNCPGREAARNGVYNFVARNQVRSLTTGQGPIWSVFIPTKDYLTGDQAHAVLPAPA